MTATSVDNDEIKTSAMIYRNNLFSIRKHESYFAIAPYLLHVLHIPSSEHINMYEKKLNLISALHKLTIEDFIDNAIKIYQDMYKEELYFEYKSYKDNKIYRLSIDKDFIKEYIMPDVLCSVFLKYVNGEMYKYNSCSAYLHMFANKTDKQTTKEIRSLNKYPHAKISSRANVLAKHWLGPFLGIVSLDSPTLNTDLIYDYSKYSSRYAAFKDMNNKESICYNKKGYGHQVNMLIPQNSLLFAALSASISKEEISINPGRFLFTLIDNYKNKKDIYNTYAVLDIYLAERLFKYNFMYYFAQNYIYRFRVGNINIKHEDLIMNQFINQSKLPNHLCKYKLTRILSNIDEVTSVSDDWFTGFDYANSPYDSKNILDDLFCFINHTLFPTLELSLSFLLDNNTVDTKERIIHYLNKDDNIISNLIKDEVALWNRVYMNFHEIKATNSTDIKKIAQAFENSFDKNKIKKLFDQINKLNEINYNNFYRSDEVISYSVNDIEQLRNETNASLSPSELKLKPYISYLDGFIEYFKSEIMPG